MNKTTDKSPFEFLYNYPISYYLGHTSNYECWSVDVETIIEHIQNIQREVIEKLQASNAKYKLEDDEHHRKLHFVEGD